MKLAQFEFESKKEIIYEKGLEEIYEKANYEKSLLRKEIEVGKNEILVVNEKNKEMKILL